MCSKWAIHEGDKCIELLIDSTLIINKSGIEGVGYGTKCHKKKFTKLTAYTILDTENVAIIADTVYTKNIEFSTKNANNKNVVPVIEDLRKNISNDIKINLYSDKGYVMSKVNKKIYSKRIM